MPACRQARPLNILKTRRLVKGKLKVLRILPAREDASLDPALQDPEGLQGRGKESRDEGQHPKGGTTVVGLVPEPDTMAGSRHGGPARTTQPYDKKSLRSFFVP